MSRHFLGALQFEYLNSMSRHKSSLSQQSFSPFNLVLCHDIIMNCCDINYLFYSYYVATVFCYLLGALFNLCRDIASDCHDKHFLLQFFIIS